MFLIVVYQLEVWCWKLFVNCRFDLQFIIQSFFLVLLFINWKFLDWRFVLVNWKFLVWRFVLVIWKFLVWRFFLVIWKFWVEGLFWLIESFWFLVCLGYLEVLGWRFVLCCCLSILICEVFIWRFFSGVVVCQLKICLSIVGFIWEVIIWRFSLNIFIFVNIGSWFFKLLFLDWDNSKMNESDDSLRSH